MLTIYYKIDDCYHSLCANEYSENDILEKIEVFLI